MTNSVSFYYHFAGSSKFNVRPPWYSRIGMSDILNNQAYENLDDWENYRYIWIDGRLGREFNFSEKIGIALEFGVLYTVYKFGNDPSGYQPIMPCIGIFTIF